MEQQADTLWDKTLRQIEPALPKPSFDAWLRNTVPLSLSQDTLVIAVGSEFAREVLQTRHADLLRRTVAQLAGRTLDLRFVIPNGHPAPADELPPVLPSPRPPAQTADRVPAALNPKYSFDTFVVGNGNRFAHAAAVAVAEAPARAYNPLFVYGGVGLGKTHLMHAIGHYALHLRSQSRVVYVPAETFTNDLITSIHDNKMMEFKDRYRSVDVLLIDDIQFIAGKERTQEEFFHTFEALHGANKQIVISSDRPPKDIPTLEDRLRSRFEWGLLADIQPPDLETRMAILRKKALVDNHVVPDEVVLFIATKIEMNIRELEGALIRAVAFASLHSLTLTRDVAEESLRDILPVSRERKVTLDHIKATVAQHYGLRLDEMTAARRTRSVAFPRQVAMYLCRELTDSSLPKIGQDFGGRDHTTVLHAHTKISRLRDEDPRFAATLKDLIDKIKST